MISDDFWSQGAGTQRVIRLSVLTRAPKATVGDGPNFGLQLIRASVAKAIG
jgi:hypothetical protein